MVIFVESLAVVMKILPGKTQDVKNMFNILKNEKWAEYLESQKRQGITMEKDFLQTSPEGDLFISYWEAEDIQKSMMVMMASKDPFDVWLKKQYENFTGINMDQLPPESEQQGPLLLLSFNVGENKKPA